MVVARLFEAGMVSDVPHRWRTRTCTNGHCGAHRRTITLKLNLARLENRVLD